MMILRNLESKNRIFEIQLEWEFRYSEYSEFGPDIRLLFVNIKRP